MGDLLRTAATAAALAVVAALGPAPAATPATDGRSFAFAAAGDHGANGRTDKMLHKLDRSAARFYLALGDLDYNETPSDAAWCRYVKRHLPDKGPGFGFEVLAGDHEDDGDEDGRIANFTRCLPDKMGATGRYGAQYAFRYPRRNPFAQLILISPGLTIGGHDYTYEPGTRDRAWLRGTIRAARAAGIRWVIVGMHRVCVSTGLGHDCQYGPAPTNLVVGEKVDLLLAAHNHIYERSKQLALGPGCTALVPEEYDPDCVVDTGADDRYTAGAGTVQVTAGMVHGGELGVDPRDGDRPYFARLCGDTTGFMAYDVTPTRLHARFVATHHTCDEAFSIVAR